MPVNETLYNLGHLCPSPANSSYRESTVVQVRLLEYTKHIQVTRRIYHGMPLNSITLVCIQVPTPGRPNKITEWLSVLTAHPEQSDNPVEKKYWVTLFVLHFFHIDCNFAFNDICNCMKCISSTKASLILFSPI